MFKIGDKVQVIWEYFSAKRGMKGTIKATKTPCWGIEFDEKIMSGHDCDGKTKDGYGYWVPPEFLEPIKSEKKVEEKTMFKIGDRVRVIKKYNAANVGDEGIIRALPNNNGSFALLECYSVEFPAWKKGHNCGGTVPSKKGLWVDPKCLELIKPKKIVITHDGKTTLARLYDGKTVVKSAEAKCDPRDEFSFIEGARLAFERLMGEEREDPPKFDKSMLTDGRFGCTSNGKWFVVVGDNLIYQRGTFDTLGAMNAEGEYFGYAVKYVVEAVSFDHAKDENVNVIWCAPDFDPKKVKDNA